MADILEILPEGRTQVYDVRKLVRAIVDRDSAFELKAEFGRTVVTALARLGGRCVGIVDRVAILQAMADRPEAAGGSS